MSDQDGEEDLEDQEEQPTDEEHEDTDEDAEKPAVEQPVVSEPEDDGVPHDLNYYVQKIAQNLEEKGNDDGAAVAASDSEDEGVLDQPENGNVLKPEYMRSLQNTPMKSAAYRESKLRVFCSVCSAVHRKLVDIREVGNFKNLRSVDFGKNYLRDLTPLQNLPYLGTVKLYQNGMGDVSTLRSRTVRYADLSGNKIKDLDGVALPSIQRLKLDFNRISSLDILNGHDFRFLRKLELRGNRLKSTVGIKHPLLEELYLAENDIREIEDLEFCPNLKRLHLRDNQVLEVTGFSKKNAKLEYVNLRNNLITFIDDAIGVTVLPKLKTLVMLDNPVQLEVDFRMVIIARMATLTILDKQEIKPYDRDWSIMTLLDSLYHEQVDLKVAVDDLIDAIEPVEMPDIATLPPSQSSLTSQTDLMEEEQWDEDGMIDEEVDENIEVQRTNSKDLIETQSIEENDLDREYFGEKEPKEGEEDEEEGEEA